MDPVVKYRKAQRTRQFAGWGSDSGDAGPFVVLAGRSKTGGWRRENAYGCILSGVEGLARRAPKLTKYQFISELK